MTKSELRDFVNELLGGRNIGETMFSTLLASKKDQVESERPWMILRAEDTSLTVSSSTTYETSHNLPTLFKSAWRIVLEDTDGNEAEVLSEIPMSKRLHYQDSDGYFYIDYANSKIYFTGAARNQSYTVHIFYIKESAAISADTDTWAFPSRFHPILGYLIAASEKMRDYDEVNMENAKYFFGEAKELLNKMIMWDAGLQVKANEF